MSKSLRAARVLLGVATLAAAGALLAGCTSNPVAADPVPGGGASASPSAGTDTGAETTPSPTPTTPAGIPLALECSAVVTAEDMERFAPGATVETGYSPAADSPATAVIDLQGTACGWSTSDGQRIEVAIAQLDPADVEARKNRTVLESKQVPTFNPVADEGYFSVVGTLGRADAFVGDYWIVTDSPLYFEPGDAQPIIEAAVAALPR